MAHLGDKRQQEIVLPEWEEVEIAIATPAEQPAEAPAIEPELVPAEKAFAAEYGRDKNRNAAAKYEFELARRGAR